MIDDIDLLSLRGPTGDGQENDPDDVAALDFGLRRAGLYDPPLEYANEPQRHATEPMIAAVKRLQEQNALRVDGYANPGGPTERVINNALLAKPRGANLLFEPIPPLRASVGNGFTNAQPDVAAVQRGLGALGYGPEDPFDRPHGLIDATTVGGVTRFQRDRGLTPDGWMAPGGETERELKQSLDDLARAKGRDWVAYAERAGRAGRAEASLLQPLSGMGNTEDGATPAAWHGAPPLAPQDRPALPDRDDDGDGRSEPTQTAPGDWIVPWLFLGLAPLLGLGEANRRRANRQGLDERDKIGGTNELIPPYVPNGPFRGPDPTQPPLDPSETRPAPYPAQPPDRMPNKVENIPPRVDFRDLVEIHPDQSDWISKFPIIVKARLGDPPVRRLNRTLAKPVPGIVKAVFPGAQAEQRGGPTQNENEDYSEEFDEFRYKKEFGITSNAAGSFKDVNFAFEYRGVKLQLIINTVTTADANSMPTTRENRQRAKMVLNAKTNTLMIDVDKLRADETVDLNAWSIFLELHLRYIKQLIDTRVQQNKIKPESNNYRFLDRFDPKQ